MSTKTTALTLKHDASAIGEHIQKQTHNNNQLLATDTSVDLTTQPSSNKTNAFSSSQNLHWTAITVGSIIQIEKIHPVSVTFNATDFIRMILAKHILQYTVLIAR